MHRVAAHGQLLLSRFAQGLWVPVQASGLRFFSVTLAKAPLRMSGSSLLISRAAQQAESDSAVIAEVMATVAVVVSLFALGVSARQARAAEAAAEYSKSQAGSAAIDAKLPTLMELLREYRSKDCTRVRHYVRSRLRQDHPPNGSGMEAIPQEILLDVLTLLHLLDNIGLFVRMRMVDTHMVSIFTGRAIEDTWLSLRPYVLEQRNKSPEYAENLEFLFDRCNATSQTRDRRML